MMQKEKNEKKLKELDKHFNALKNPTVILVKKRQIMFSVFGDYRSKIKKEEQSNQSATTVLKNSLKFVEAPQSSAKSDNQEAPNSKLIKVARKRDSNIKNNVEKSTGFKFDFKISD